MLACYLTWHLKEAWAPPLFKYERSAAAKRKASTKRTASGEIAPSFRSLLGELALKTPNAMRIGAGDATSEQLTAPSGTQARALEPIERYPALKQSRPRQ